MYSRGGGGISDFFDGSADASFAEWLLRVAEATGIEKEPRWQAVGFGDPGDS